MSKIKWMIISVVVIGLSIWLVATKTFFFRWDLTDEKRYTIAQSSKNIVKHLKAPVDVIIYLGGNIDANMVRLRNSVLDLLDEYNIYSDKRISYRLVDPSQANFDKERFNNYQKLENRGLRGITVSQYDSDGKMSQKIIFPWAEVISDGDTVPVALLEPSDREDGEQNVNRSIEENEFDFTDAFRILNRNHIDKIAFLEGQGELDEAHTYSVTTALSRYFQVDRGVLGNDASILNDYKALIIAKPTEPFSESDKFIIDQYIMNGGKVLWLVDGVKLSKNDMSQSGLTPVIALDLNLQDMLFKYGVRLTNSLVEDLQCATIAINIARPGENPQYQNVPWFFSPLLQPSPYSPITKNNLPVMADFASALDFTNNNDSIEKNVLLITSNASHIDFAPTDIDLSQMTNIDPKNYFDRSYLPVAASLEGVFPSIYAHRMAPQGMKYKSIKAHSVPTRMVVVADGDIISNDVQRSGKSYMVLPPGYDRFSQKTYGNQNFVINSMLYLTDNSGLMALRNRSVKMRLLNKAMVLQNHTRWIWVNISIPLIILFMFGMVFSFVRKMRNKND